MKKWKKLHTEAGENIRVAQVRFDTWLTPTCPRTFRRVDRGADAKGTQEKAGEVGEVRVTRCVY